MNAKRKKRPDPLVGFLFKILVYFLKNDIKDISWTKEKKLVIADESGKNKEVGGMNAFKSGESLIFISDAYQTMLPFAARLLLHELLHCLLAIGCDEKEELVVRRFERLLWERLTTRQKQFLIKRLPPLTKYAIPPE